MKFCAFEVTLQKQFLLISANHSKSVFSTVNKLRVESLSLSPSNEMQKKLNLQEKIATQDPGGETAYNKHHYSAKLQTLGGGGGYLRQFLLGMCRWPLRTPTPL